MCLSLFQTDIMQASDSCIVEPMEAIHSDLGHSKLQSRGLKKVFDRHARLT